MLFHEADLVSVILFSIFAVLMFTLCTHVFLVTVPRSKFSVIFRAYIALFSILVIFGFVKEFMLQLAPLVLISAPILATVYAFSEFGRKVAEKYSFSQLVGFQAFRLLLELLLHHWAKINTIPETMTWSGQNFDIIAGILALIVMPFANRSRTAVWTFEIIASLLLLNVIRVAVMSSPFPFSWQLENPLQLALYFPYALIIPLFIAPAFFGHWVLARKLLKN